MKWINEEDFSKMMPSVSLSWLQKLVSTLSRVMPTWTSGVRLILAFADMFHLSVYNIIDPLMVDEGQEQSNYLRSSFSRKMARSNFHTDHGFITATVKLPFRLSNPPLLKESIVNPLKYATIRTRKIRLYRCSTSGQCLKLVDIKGFNYIQKFYRIPKSST